MEIKIQINGGHWKWWVDEYKRWLFSFERQLAYNTNITFYWEFITYLEVKDIKIMIQTIRK